MAGLVAELKRRKVMRVAAVYAVVGWLIIQVANATFADFEIPVWAFRFVVLMLILGFPVAIILAWAFELTPEGVKLTKNVSEEEKQVTSQSKRNWLSLGFAAALPTVIFGTLAAYFYFNRSEPTASSEKSIAVLPLANMSPDPENAFFADGVQEDILTNLSKIRDLLVISRSSTLQYRNPDRNLKQIGVELGVRYLAEGSVRRAGDQVLVTVQLIDTHTDGHIWAENYNRKLDDIFAIQAAIAKEIAGQLEAAISPEEVAQIDRRPTENQEAYDYYVKARQMIESVGGRGDEKIELLEKAVGLDPDFAEAWAHLTVECIWWWDYGKRRNDAELLAKAHHASEEADRLGSGLPHTAYARSELAWFVHRDLEASIRHLGEALAIDPSYHPALYFSGARNWALGRATEARYYLEVALRIDPLSERTNYSVSRVYVARGLWEKARALITDNVKRADDVESWRFRMAELDYSQTGDRQGFNAAIEAIPGFTEDPFGQSWMALQTRDYQSALQSLGELDSSSYFGFHGSYESPMRPVNLVSALVWFELGDEEKWLIETGKARTYLEGILEMDPMKQHPYYWSCLTIGHALAGEREQMEAAMAKVRELTNSASWKHFYQAPCEMHVAIAYLIMGGNDAAIETLTQASKMGGDVFLKRELGLWFIFDRLRGDPRFDALLEN